MTHADSLELLQQTRDRAARLIEQLERDEADMAANLAIDAHTKAEGLVAIARTLDAARRLLQDAEAAVERRRQRASRAGFSDLPGMASHGQSAEPILRRGDPT
jgi:hypothetical protein